MENKGKGLEGVTMDEDINLVDVLQAAIDYNLANVHTSFPGKITAFQKGRATVDVLPSVKKLLKNGKTMDMPILKGVPIVYPAGRSGGLTFTLSPGDGVLVVCSERCIDQWKEGETSAAPLSSRKFDITDAFAIPCVFPYKDRPRTAKRFYPQNGTMLTGPKVFVGDPEALKAGTVKPVNVDVVAILLEALAMLDALVTAGGIVSPPGVSGGPCTTPTLTPRISDIKAYQQALQSLLLTPQ